MVVALYGALYGRYTKDKPAGAVDKPERLRA